jgi:radical SAM-linked protein
VKVRICFGKTEEGRYLSHLDLARAMERSLRRAKAPLAFSEGFNPHPKISFASALAVGMAGYREYVDVEFAYRVNISNFCKSLEAEFPPALAFVAAEEIGAGGKSLSASVNLAVYRLSVEVSAEDEAKAADGIAKVLAAAELWRKPKEKPGKKPAPAKEVRGLVRRVAVVGAGGGEGVEAAGRRALAIEMELGMAAEGQLRPQELWEMIGAAGGFAPEPPLSVCRMALLVRQDGRTYSPMEGVAI